MDLQHFVRLPEASPLIYTGHYDYMSHVLLSSGSNLANQGASDYTSSQERLFLFNFFHLLTQFQVNHRPEAVNLHRHHICNHMKANLQYQFILSY